MSDLAGEPVEEHAGDTKAEKPENEAPVKERVVVEL